MTAPSDTRPNPLARIIAALTRDGASTPAEIVGAAVLGLAVAAGFVAGWMVCP